MRRIILEFIQFDICDRLLRISTQLEGEGKEFERDMRNRKREWGKDLVKEKERKKEKRERKRKVWKKERERGEEKKRKKGIEKFRME